jgi:serine/threonine protein kinase
MDIEDVSTLGKTLLKLRLVTEEQFHDAVGRADDPNDLGAVLRSLERLSLLTPWQRHKVLKGDEDGFFLGGYRLLYKIASGSFGRVFRADEPRTGRVVAVKVLRRRWSEDEQRIGLFLREGKVGQSIRHSNIVEVLTAGKDAASGQYYIVMEFVEGGNLREILKIRKKYSVAEALRILEDMASGLAFAYARGITHRDIKLTNILVSSHGEAKLVDFGLAQLLSSIAKEEEKVDRTVDYAGLERATNAKPGDVRSDIYFLGCSFYESLTGRPPLEMTRDKHARMRKDRFEKVKPIQPEEIDGPPSVLALVETMMSLDPQRRFQTPAQLLDAIRTVRREVEGKGGKSDGKPAHSVFVAESDERLQDLLRDKLKDLGFRVFVSTDPNRALDRFRQQPYDALIVDARTTGEEGFRIFERVLAEALLRHVTCAAILILNGEQTDWQERLHPSPHVSVLVDPTFKHLRDKLKGLLRAHETVSKSPV